MRDDAAAVNAAIHKGDELAAAEAMKKSPKAARTATPASIRRSTRLGNTPRRYF